MTRQTRLETALREPAYGLAALRIMVVAVLLLTPELSAAPSLAATPERLVASPEGLGWLAGARFSPGLVAGVRVLAYSAGATALLGYWSRLSCGVLAVVAMFLLSFAERVGATVHGMHLLWLLALLAASPCGDVWSLDAWGRAAPTPSLRYGVPLGFARALLGVVYFFPGLHKLLSGGLEWGSAANVLGIMYGKWFQHGRVPALRIDDFPLLLSVGGLGVLLFELSFIVLALLPRTRLWALGLGLGFHLSTRLFFFIDFPSLWVCYVVLVPWQRLLRRFQPAAKSSQPTETWPVPSVVVGSFLLLATSVQGLRGRTQAYPFACYPTFEGLVPLAAPDLIVELVDGQSQVRRLERGLDEQRTQRQWGTVYWLLGAYGGTASDAQLREFARQRARARGASWENVARVRLLAADYSTRPADWGKPPLRTRVLRELAP